MMRRLVYTRHDGGVTVCCPSLPIIRRMNCGGMWGKSPRGWVSRQIDDQIAAGHNKDIARRFIRALQFGGCSEPEALAIIRDRDCAPLGTGIELWHVADIPGDRWFRDAWVRSHNGGPISINLKSAKAIQFQKIKHAVQAENKRRETDIERFDQKLEPDFHQLKSQILAASDEIELRHVWPKGLT